MSSVYLQLLAGIEVRNLLAGRTYDSRVIDSPDKATRWAIATELLAALFSQDFEEQERARQLFIDHGYFDEATRRLKSAESPADRAAAARKLGIVGSQLATAHLIAALFDDVPEVRRAGAEALIQIGDPGVGTAALNAILIGEMARDVAEVSAATGRVAENIKLDETPSAKYAGEKVWFRARQPSVANLFSLITNFDDDSPHVRSATARALYELEPHGTPESFSQALVEGSPDRRRKIGAAMAASGLATNAINNLTGESREDTYNALCLLYVMEVEKARRKAEEEAQRLEEEQAQIEAAEAARRAEAEERSLEQGSIPVSESVGDICKPRSLARRFLLRCARKI